MNGPDREHFPRTFDDRRIIHELGDPFGIHGGGHDKDLQIGSQNGTQVKRKRKSQIGMDAPLVELIEDHSIDSGKLRIALDHPCQDSFGQHFDPGLG